ncbi:unnamed protein product [Adineta ricciae]|uniref:Uncharacterized protein n=1 Tax=Adineta ricciae TaxID=249248 RepID=A0A816HJB4_ADIRI|nr:unnamed protein product [Adineta ricciae]
MVGTSPYDIFINTNNTVFVAATSFNCIQSWSEKNITLMKNISSNLAFPYSVVVTINNDIYISNNISNYRVVEWTSNATTGVNVMYINGICYNIFIDFNENLYCSISNEHQVIRKLFTNDANTTEIIAGTGSAGLASNILNIPRGIFVDLYFNLYVADCNNDRVQLFAQGYVNAYNYYRKWNIKLSDWNCS